MRKIIIIPLTIVITVVLLFAISKFTSLGSLFSSGVKETITTHSSMLEKVTELGKLEAMKYQFRDVMTHVVKYNSSIWPDSKVLVIIKGEAVGCIDLSKIQAKDIKETADSIYIHLPNPELCYHKVDLKNTEIYEAKNLYWSEKKIIQQAMRRAEDEVKKIALKSDLLERSKTSAEKTLRAILGANNKKKIGFTYPPKEKKWKNDK